MSCKNMVRLFKLDDVKEFEVRLIRAIAKLESDWDERCKKRFRKKTVTKRLFMGSLFPAKVEFELPQSVQDNHLEYKKMFYTEPYYTHKQKLKDTMTFLHDYLKGGCKGELILSQDVFITINKVEANNYK